MTKTEAIQAMKSGKKVHHRYFTDDEFMIMTKDGDYKFEDGVICDPSMFWKDRNTMDWQEDWEIVN